MGQLIDIAGQRFGLLTAIEKVSTKGCAKWRCQCDCGNEKIVRSHHLRSGAIRSCGHLIGEVTRQRSTKHGHKARGSTDATYSTWCAMWTRCTNPNQATWSQYGGRGIKVCERWEDFALFLEDMGERPLGATLDRVDTDGDYTPDNCRWANASQQARNKRGSLHVTHNGETKPLAQWAEELGMVYATLYNRIHRYGWSVERALGF